MPCNLRRANISLHIDIILTSSEAVLVKNIHSIGLPNNVAVNIILVRINFTAENKNVE
jgi:predicted transcriptional regulator